MKAWIATLLVAGLTAFPARAQDSLAGTYRGSFTIQNYNVGVTLVIGQVEGGKFTGTGTFHGGSCAGEFPIQGGVKDGGIGLISAKKGGTGGDCLFGFRGRIEGNQLVGRMGPYDVVLTK